MILEFNENIKKNLIAKWRTESASAKNKCSKTKHAVIIVPQFPYGVNHNKERENNARWHL